MDINTNALSRTTKSNYLSRFDVKEPLSVSHFYTKKFKRYGRYLRVILGTSLIIIVVWNNMDFDMIERWKVKQVENFMWLICACDSIRATLTRVM